MDEILKKKALKKVMSEKMTDMGYKSEMMETVSPKQTKSRIEYPTLHLHRKVPLWLMNKQLGNQGKITALYKIVSKSINENDGGKRESATIEIQKLGE